MKHNRTRLLDYAYIACLLLEFPHGALLGSFAFVNQPSRHFDGDFVDGRSELFLEKDLGSVGCVEDGDYADSVDCAVFGTCLSRPSDLACAGYMNKDYILDVQLFPRLVSRPRDLCM